MFSDSKWVSLRGLVCLCCFFKSQSTIFLSCGDILLSYWVELVLCKHRVKCLAQGHDAVPAMSL